MQLNEVEVLLKEKKKGSKIFYLTKPVFQKLALSILEHEPFNVERNLSLSCLAENRTPGFIKGDEE